MEKEWWMEYFVKSFTHKVLKSLSRTNNNITQTARELGVSRTYIYKVLKGYKKLGEKGIALAGRGRPAMSLKHLNREQIDTIIKIIKQHTARQAKVAYKPPTIIMTSQHYGWEKQHPKKGWYSRSVIELVKKKYDIDISYGTARRILDWAFY